jgi:transposase
MISPETRAEIFRLYKVEHFSITKIAKLTHVHHSTVRNVIDNQGRIATTARPRGSILDAYVGIIQQKLDEYPDICAKTIWLMLKDRGFGGSEQTVRARVQLMRGPRIKRAYMPVTVFPGDEAQVDWAHFGSLTVGKTVRKLSLFVMVLSYSRAIFAKFFFDQTLDSFLAGHVEAFQYFGGVPRALRYDNLKAAVAERYGQTIRYNAQLLQMAAHYGFKPSACNPYSGHEKGRVERSVRYIREGFFIGKQLTTIEKLNTALTDWLGSVAQNRAWVDDRRKTVFEIFDEERPRLISLPGEPFCVHLEKPVRSGKIPFIRFDKNDYSIPYQLVGQPLSLIADHQTITIARAGEVVARHTRSFSGGEKILTQEHFSGLTEHRPGAETVAARCYFAEMIPEAAALFSLMVERGTGIGPATAKMFNLLRTYGKPVLTEAIKQAIERSHAEPNYLAQACEHLSRRRMTPAILPIELTPGIPGADLEVKPHDVSSYDTLTE